MHTQFVLNQVVFISCSNMKPTKYGPVIVFGLSMLRWFILYKPSLNITFTNDFLYTEIIHIIVFVIGFYLSIECLLSILSYFGGLKLSNVQRYTPTFSLYSIVLVLCMIASIGNAIRLFMGVRDLWTQHFALPIQVLHPLPTIFLIVQAIIQGI